MGGYDISQARTLAQLAERYEVTPLAQAAFAAFPGVELTDSQARRLAHGAQLPLRELIGQGRVPLEELVELFDAQLPR